MSAFRYDLHVHSCLSPCGEDDMTPFSIAGMAKLNGLSLVALTDHNTCGNCQTFLTACESYGIIGVPGMELTTAEDIHLVCLFPNIERAVAFERELRPHRPGIRNRPEIFGRQLLIGPEDEPVGEEPDLLINAGDLPLEDAWKLVNGYGGAVYPAHVDREANGIIAILGGLPERPDFRYVEFHDPANVLPYGERYGIGDRRTLVSSDAHRLWEISDGEQSIRLDVGEEDSAKVREALIRKLRGEA